MVNSHCTIRSYEISDAPALAELRYASVHSLGAAAYTQEQLHAWCPAQETVKSVRARCEDGRQNWVALAADKRIIGMIDLEANGHVDYLYVHPEHARRGLASGLLAHMERAARAARLDRIFTEASELARPAFTKAGFHVRHRRDFEIRGVMIHNYAMEKTLT